MGPHRQSKVTIFPFNTSSPPRMMQAMSRAVSLFRHFWNALWCLGIGDSNSERVELRLLRLEERRVLDAAGLVADLNPGVESSEPADFTEFNDYLYFSAEGVDATGEFVGRELYRMDATGEVSLFADLNPGAADAAPAEFTVYNGQLYFAATSADGRELFKTDGNTVTQVADIFPGVIGSQPASSSPSEFQIFEGELYFAATQQDGRELFRMDANESVFRIRKTNDDQLISDPSGLTVFNGKLYFSATANDGRELFVLNRGQNPNQVSDINPAGDANPEELIVFDNALYFVADASDGRTLFRQSPSGVNPVQVLAPDVIVNPRDLTIFDGNLFFVAEDQNGDGNLFLLGETTQAIRSTDGRSLGDATSLTEFNGTLYFSAETEAGRRLFRLQTDAQGYSAVEIEMPNGVVIERIQPENLVEFPIVAGQLYFRATGPLGVELYRVDADDNVTLAVDTNLGAESSNPDHFVIFSDQFFFTAHTQVFGRELYRLTIGDSSLTIDGDKIIFRDIHGERNNQLVLFSDGSQLRLRDENGYEIFTTIDGVTGSGTNEIALDFDDLEGLTQWLFDVQGGADSLTIHLDSNVEVFFNNFPTLQFDGGLFSRTDEVDVIKLVGNWLLDWN